MDSLKRKVDKGELEEMPPITTIEMVRLQFVPNVNTSETAGRFSGRLKLRRGVQMRSLRKQHEDQHWVNSMTRYILEWLIELKKKYEVSWNPLSYIKLINVSLTYVAYAPSQ